MRISYQEMTKVVFLCLEMHDVSSFSKTAISLETVTGSWDIFCNFPE